MKKALVFSLVFMMLFISGCGSHQIEIPENLEDAPVLIMASEYEKNKLRAEETYVGTWAIFDGALDGIYEDSFYIISSFSSGKSVKTKCVIKNEDVKQALLKLNEGDIVEVTALITGLLPGSYHSYSGSGCVLSINVDAYALEQWP